MPTKKLIKKAPAKAVMGDRRIAAGEFKAKCLGLMREVASTGSGMTVTVRGEPLVEVIPARTYRRQKNKDAFIGRLEGILEIAGDPDDLVKPVFEREDYDMLK